MNGLQIGSNTQVVLRTLAGLGVVAGVLVVALSYGAHMSSQADAKAQVMPSTSTPLLDGEALLTASVDGLQNTRATASVVPVTGQPFTRARRVTLAAGAAQTNATQFNLPITAPVRQGEGLLASFYIRGAAKAGVRPAQLEFLFERSSAPWTKSVTWGVTGGAVATQWKKIVIPFKAAQDYGPGQAMASFRLAFGPQEVELGGLRLENYGLLMTGDALTEMAAAQLPLGRVRATVLAEDARQVMVGFGGNFAQPRYGATEAMDAVGTYNLAHLDVVHARIALPLDFWTPQRGVYVEEKQALAALLQMQMMAQRKLPITASVWEGPQWMLPGEVETGRVLPPENYAACIEAIGRFLVVARDKYGAHADYFSFNEPDYGVNFKFTSAQLGRFLRQAGPRFAQLGLKTKFLVGDTANGAPCAAYIEPLLQDKTLQPYLGPIAFHSWDALSAPQESYAAIAALGKKYNKPVWCTEAGHDAQLWRTKEWDSWQNAMRTAQAYERSINLAGAEQLDYWTYQDNYPLTTKDGSRPYPVWQVLRQMEAVFPRGARVHAVQQVGGQDQLRLVATRGPTPGQVGWLLINPAGSGQVTLTGLPPGGLLQVVENTRRAQGQAPRETRADGQGNFALDVPANAVVTVVSG